MRFTHDFSRRTCLVGILCRRCFQMSSYRTIARALATAFLVGHLETDELVVRGTRLLGKRWRFLHPLAQRTVAMFGGEARPRSSVLTSFILADRAFKRAIEKYDVQLVEPLGFAPRMAPIEQAISWRVPPICTTGELADWLGITPSELDWYADVRCLEQKQSSEKLRHYRYRPLIKQHGRIRLIEAPKDRLKAIQRQIQTRILDHVPPHDAVHGFRRRRSIRSFAQPHVRQAIVIKVDLEDFFPSISVSRVNAMFRALGYPEHVADRLAGLCSNAAPSDIWDTLEAHTPDHKQNQARWMYARPHLPQGAPTSPALANLCAYRLDCRLAGLARAAGAVYTRYADDLAFSGGEEFARTAKRFQLHVSATIMEEGFQVHHRKTRIMRPGVCQRIAGVIVNEHLSLPRADRDRLKATLTICIRFGPASQNLAQHEDFRNHLQGRVAFVESINADQGRKLRRLFDQIVW